MKNFTLQKFVLVWAGLLFVVFGIVYLLFPTTMIELSGMQIPTLPSKVDAWAIYGGMQIGFGLYLLYSLRDNSLIPGAVIAVAFMFGGIALCRTAGMFYQHSFDQYSLSALMLEWPSTLLALWAWLSRK